MTFELVLSHLRKRDFAVLSTISKGGKPHSVGVNYGVSEHGRAFVIYVMTRKHLQKARNIAENPNISLSNRGWIAESAKVVIPPEYRSSAPLA